MIEQHQSANNNDHAGLDQIFANIDRLKAFRQARSHSRLVKLLRFLLPIGVVGLLGLLLAPTLLRPEVKGLSVTAVEPVSLTSYIMRNPHYEGFDKKNGNYTIDAESAKIDIKNSGSIPLTNIRIKVTHLDKSGIALKAKTGLYNREQKSMDLAGDIQFHNSTGMSAYFKTAKINMDSKTIISDRAVRVEMPQGKVTASAIKIYGQKKYVEFIKDVRLFLVAPAPEKGKAVQPKAKKSSTPQQNSLIGGMSMDRSLPILSRADFLAINDNKKTALLTGNVAVNQGIYELLTNRLQISYSQPPKKGQKAKTAASSPLSPAASGKIKSITADKGIVIYTADGRSVQGETARFNMEKGIVRIEGSAKNKMVISSKTGTVTAQSVTMENAKNKIFFDRDVVAGLSRNTIYSDSLQINTKTNIVDFDGKVRLVAYNQQKQKKNQGKGKPKKVSKKKSGLLNMDAGKMDSSKPINISSAHLRIDDKKKTAIFRGKVVAQQDIFTLRSEKLTAFYTGQMQPMPPVTSPKKQHKKKRKSASDGQIKKIIAHNKVLITSGDDQTASGDKATFNVLTNIAVISGNVVLSQKGNILKGEKLVLNLSTGHYKLKNSKNSRVKLLVIPGNGKSFKIPR